ncbi:MAG: hypothetical protein ACMG55_12685 [Microcoleus sp.]
MGTVELRVETVFVHARVHKPGFWLNQQAATKNSLEKTRFLAFDATV